MTELTSGSSPSPGFCRRLLRHPCVLPGALIGLAVAVLLLRLIHLDQRPLHTDEAVHAVKLGTLLETGTYVYNPHEFHGPSIYYFALPLVRLSGATRLAEMDSSLPMRASCVIFGSLLIVLPLLFLGALSGRAILVAALLAAVSPAFTFYSRYFIQEVPLTVFTWLAVASAWQYLQTRRPGWALLCGLSMGLMQASKETAVVLVAAAVAACGMAVVLAHGLERQHQEPRARLRKRDLTAAVLLGVLTALTLLTNFWRNPEGALDAVRAYSTYLDRAGTGDGHGTGPAAHIHPWPFYLQLLFAFRGTARLWWSEILIVLLALPALALAWKPALHPETNRHLTRFLLVFVTLLFAIYSTIPYKTPWNVLGWHYGLILLAGIGTDVLFRLLSPREGAAGAATPAWAPRLRQAGAAAVIAAGIGHLALQSYRAAFLYYADPRNPWVYGHTVPNLARLVERVNEIAALSPDAAQIPIHVVASNDDYWPLPWDLRRYDQVGFWHELPATLDAPLIVSSADLTERVERRLKSPYQQEFYGLRPDVLLTLYIEESLWNSFLRTQQGPAQ